LSLSMLPTSVSEATESQMDKWAPADLNGRIKQASACSNDKVHMLTQNQKYERQFPVPYAHWPHRHFRCDPHLLNPYGSAHTSWIRTGQYAYCTWSRVSNPVLRTPSSRLNVKTLFPPKINNGYDQFYFPDVLWDTMDEYETFTFLDSLIYGRYYDKQ
jgi:hypothetical protein